MKNLKKQNSKISVSLLISLVIHFVFTIFIFKPNNFKIVDTDKLPQKRKLIPIKAMDIKSISKEKIAEIKRRMQIVQTAQDHKAERPVVSRFEGQSNQQVDRQTIAKVVDKFKEAGLGKTQMAAKASAKPNTKSKTPKLSLSEIGSFTINTHTSSVDDQKLANELEKQIKGTKGLENGKAGEVGLAASNDFIEDVPLGDVTNLNTTENKYYGFYHRIRQKLEQHWGSTIHDRARSLYKNGRRMPANENLITSVTVVLSEKGNIVDIKIEGTSGVRELDQAAIESFNKAGPFPNPPKGLLVDGRAVISWGFVVKS